jgi:hypothetical protein
MEPINITPLKNTASSNKIKLQSFRPSHTDFSLDLAPDLSLTKSENELVKRADTRWNKKRHEMIRNQMFSYFFLLEGSRSNTKDNLKNLAVS